MKYVVCEIGIRKKTIWWISKNCSEFSLQVVSETLPVIIIGTRKKKITIIP